MRLVAFEAVATALHAEGVRHVVSGGLAVNAHGYVRTTMDIDLVVALDADNILAAFRALSTLAYKPLAPILPADCARPEQRDRWRAEKGMQVLNLHSPAYPAAPVDVFINEPFDFAHEYEVALRSDVLTGVEVRYVSVDTLIAMKRATGRPRDLDDIQHLECLAMNSGDGDDADPWRYATFEGARRAMLRAAKAMTVRQRLEAMDELNRIAGRMQRQRLAGPNTDGDPPAVHDPADAGARSAGRRELS